MLGIYGNLKSVPDKVTHLAPIDPVAEMYRRVRDIVVLSDGVGQGDRIGILELLKNELIRNRQSQIDDAMEG